MNFGPMEYAAYLGRRRSRRIQGKAVETHPSASPRQIPDMVAEPSLASARDVPVSVYEAVVMRAPCSPQEQGPVQVRILETRLPVVLVLSSHQAVEWEIAASANAQLRAVLVSGYGVATVHGAGAAPVASIGGFHAFKRGSAEFLHLEDEILRRAGGRIASFQSLYAGTQFEIRAD